MNRRLQSGRVDLRALTFVAALATMITAVTVIAHHRDDASGMAGVAGLTDRIDVHGAQSGDRQPSWLGLRLTGTGISLAIPNCNMDGLDSRFFLHVYTGNSQSANANDYLNRDFAIPSEQIKRVTTSAGLQCVVERSFDTSHAKEVVLGQFTMPDGRCCHILWSRNYVIGQ